MDAVGNLMHEVWMDESEIEAGKDWREKIDKGVLERAFPQVRPEKDAKLRIYPMSIEPRAELPSDMKDNYHFVKYSCDGYSKNNKGLFGFIGRIRE